MVTITMDDKKMSWGFQLVEKSTPVEILYGAAYVIEHLDDEDQNVWIYICSYNLVACLLGSMFYAKNLQNMSELIVGKGSLNIKNLYVDESIKDNPRADERLIKLFSTTQMIPDQMNREPVQIKVKYDVLTGDFVDSFEDKEKQKRDRNKPDNDSKQRDETDNIKEFDDDNIGESL